MAMIGFLVEGRVRIRIRVRVRVRIYVSFNISISCRSICRRSICHGTVFVGQKEKPIQYLSCKNLYSILSQEGNLVEGPPYWANLIDSNINWSNVYKRNLKDIKDNKLTQFNFKLLYNLLLVKRKLFLWQLCNTDTCEACTCREDLYHALLT